MAGHETHFLVSQILHASTLRDDVANELVAFFQATLLVGLVRIAVEHACPSLAVIGHLNRPGVLELRTVVRLIPNSG